MSPVTIALALAIAQVAVNEAGFDAPNDLRLIWQVTEAHGDTDAERLAWLRAHSSCVLGDDDASDRPGNCAWTRGLTWSSAEPAGWDNLMPWSRYVARWSRVRRLALRLVTGQDTYRPCEGTPVTWGGREIDMAQALAKGLRPLGCRGRSGVLTRNEGFAR